MSNQSPPLTDADVAAMTPGQRMYAAIERAECEHLTGDDAAETVQRILALSIF